MGCLLSMEFIQTVINNRVVVRIAEVSWIRKSVGGQYRKSSASAFLEPINLLQCATDRGYAAHHL